MNFLEEEALPALIVWVKGLENLSFNSPLRC